MAEPLFVVDELKLPQELLLQVVVQVTPALVASLLTVADTVVAVPTCRVETG